MRRCLALSLALAAALSACGEKSETTGKGGSAPPPPPADAPSPSAQPIDPATTGSVKGVVRLDGWLKPDAPLAGIRGIAYCNAQHPDGPPPEGKLVLGDGQTMANVLVYVKSGLGAWRYDPARESVLLDQLGCLYTPHVLALRTNQPLRVHNSDSILHNVHFQPKFNAKDNKGQTTKGSEDTFTFPIPEVGINFKCDVHPWMSAYVHVFSHPFFQVTAKDGAYTLSGLPAGEYEIQAWHERFEKPEVAKVKIEAKGAATQDFTFKGGQKP